MNNNPRKVKSCPGGGIGGSGSLSTWGVGRCEHGYSRHHEFLVDSEGSKMGQSTYRVAMIVEVKATSAKHAEAKMTEALENLTGTLDGSYRLTATHATPIMGEKD